MFRMKIYKMISSAVIMAALVVTSCVTTKSSGYTDNSQQTDTFAVHLVDIKSEVLTISDGIRLYDAGTTDMAIAKKYGYKRIDGYKAYNLKDYAVLFYKNSQLPRKLSSGAYLDMPKPMKKGVSSYVGINKNEVEIGVFSQKAYDSLLSQVIQAGFALIHDGYEKEYSNGIYSIYCYAPGRRIRISRPL